MEDAVKGIFKTLIKIPVIILVCFGVFNVFAFGLSYFNMLGLSYIVMQTAIENNFIPNEDRITIQNYMDSMETAVLSDIRFTDNTQMDRKQYGETIEVGVQARYNFIFPLTTKEQLHGDGVQGLKETTSGDNFGNTGYRSNAELENIRRDKMDNAKSNIVIKYKIPGLKYYPDMD